MRNFRDFGYNNVKENIFLRGEALNKVSRKDVRTLLNKYNLKLVVDLRTDSEYVSKPDKILPGVEYIHLPVIQTEEMGASSEKEGKEEATKQQKLPDMYRYYQLMVGENKQEFWTKLFETLLNHQDGSMLFHCTVGKDRTGIVSAIILTALGVDKDTIYKDYLLTNEHPVIPFVYKVYALKFKKPVRKQFYELFYVQKAYLDFAFAQIDEIYGSIQSFFQIISASKRR